MVRKKKLKELSCDDNGLTGLDEGRLVYFYHDPFAR